MPGTHLTVVPGDVAQECQQHRDGVQRHLRGPVVRHVAHPHPVVARGIGVHSINSDAVPAHQSQLRQRLKHVCRDRCVLHKQRVDPGRCFDDLLGRPAGRGHKLMARGHQDLGLDVE